MAQETVSGSWKPSRRKATAQMHISAANAENKKYEVVAIIMAVVMFLAGTIFLCLGAARSDVNWGMVVSGTIFEVMFLFPLRFIINTRRHNIAVRMLGIVLDNVEDEETLNQVLLDSFLNIVGEIPKQSEKGKNSA